MDQMDQMDQMNEQDLQQQGSTTMQALQSLGQQGLDAMMARAKAGAAAVFANPLISSTALALGRAQDIGVTSGAAEAMGALDPRMLQYLPANEAKAMQQRLNIYKTSAGITRSNWKQGMDAMRFQSQQLKDQLEMILKYQQKTKNDADIANAGLLSEKYKLELVKLTMEVQEKAQNQTRDDLIKQMNALNPFKEGLRASSESMTKYFEMFKSVMALVKPTEMAKRMATFQENYHKDVTKAFTESKDKVMNYAIGFFNKAIQDNMVNDPKKLDSALQQYVLNVIPKSDTGVINEFTRYVKKVENAVFTKDPKQTPAIFRMAQAPQGMPGQPGQMPGQPPAQAQEMQPKEKITKIVAFLNEWNAKTPLELMNELSGNNQAYMNALQSGDSQGQTAAMQNIANLEILPFSGVIAAFNEFQMNKMSIDQEQKQNEAFLKSNLDITGMLAAMQNNINIENIINQRLFPQVMAVSLGLADASGLSEMIMKERQKANALQQQQAQMQPQRQPPQIMPQQAQGAPAPGQPPPPPPTVGAGTETGYPQPPRVKPQLAQFTQPAQPGGVA